MVYKECSRVLEKIMFYLLQDGCAYLRPQSMHYGYTWSPKRKNPAGWKLPATPWREGISDLSSCDTRLRSPNAKSLRVQSTRIWSVYGFCIRNLNYGLGYILHVWVRGPLGNQYIQMVKDIEKSVNAAQPLGCREPSAPARVLAPQGEPPQIHGFAKKGSTQKPQVS